MPVTRPSTPDEGLFCVFGQCVGVLGVDCLRLYRFVSGAPGGLHSTGGFITGVCWFLEAVKNVSCEDSNILMHVLVEYTHSSLLILNLNFSKKYLQNAHMQIAIEIQEV